MKHCLTKFIIPLCLLLSAFHLVGCSGKKIDENNPQEVFNDAEEDAKDKRFAVALDKLKTVKNKFPYSHLATLAQLRIADIHFSEEAYAEAAGAYETFRDLHPKHEKADYVMFQIGESYFLQLPDTEDRDLSPGNKAIESYRELLAVYPNSQYAEKARQHSKESTERLASKERYVADFYYKREMYDSAATRYEKIVNGFSGSNIEEYAYWKWAQSLIQNNQLDEAKHAFRLYVSRHPNGRYVQKAGDWLDDHGGR